jgi:3-dehydroquinate dehydratase II
MPGSVLVLNGPNLNLLGQRDPGTYGSATMQDVEQACLAEAAKSGLSVQFFQSSSEGELIDRIHEAHRQGESVLVNPGGYSHTSIALMDALAILSTPVVEVHLSNIQAREEFRRLSYVSLVADAVIAGAGVHGYTLGLSHIAHLLGAGTGDDGPGQVESAARP